MVFFDHLELHFTFKIPHLVSYSPGGFIEFVSKSVSKAFKNERNKSLGQSLLRLPQYHFILAGVRGSRTHLPRSSRGITDLKSAQGRFYGLFLPSGVAFPVQSPLYGVVQSRELSGVRDQNRDQNARSLRGWASVPKKPLLQPQGRLLL